MPRSKLYKQTVPGTRQILIIGTNEENKIKIPGSDETESQLCALILEWLQEKKLPQDEEDLTKVTESITRFVLGKVDNADTSLEGNEMDIMAYMIAGLAGDTLIEKQGYITLGSLCDYVNDRLRAENKPKTELISRPSNDLANKVIRIHPRKLNERISNDVRNFYRDIQRKDIESMADAVRKIQRLAPIANEKLLDILKNDVKNALKWNYETILGSWLNDNIEGLRYRVDRKIVEEKDGWVKNALYDLRKKIRDERIHDLETYLDYSHLAELIENKDLFNIFASIGYVIRNSKHKAKLDNEEGDPLSDIINNYLGYYGEQYAQANSDQVKPAYAKR